MLAISCSALLIVLVPQAASPLGWLGLSFLLTTAGGYILAAIFPTDPITVGPDDASAAARLHAIAFMVGVPNFILTSQLISVSLAGNPGWDDVRLGMFGLAHLNWIGLAAMVTILARMLSKIGGFGPDVLIGWPNRLMFFTYFGWLMLTVWPLAKFR
ncbi:MAG: DUF998 domain-containing protein [Candidatus Devosia euplotis]|nr:DUF998 domain-containing protein [Candidatus Devosia euplotis]